jgi:hypothetical protein
LTLTLRDPRECKVAEGLTWSLPRKSDGSHNQTSSRDVRRERVRTLHFYDETSLLNPDERVDSLSRLLFQYYGMDLLGPPLLGKWKVEEDGRIIALVD